MESVNLRGVMDLNLLTIANRASLGSDIQSSVANARNRIVQIKNLVNKIEESGAFSAVEVKQELEFSLIGVVSILEQHLNDMLHHIYVAFPSKLGRKQFEVGDLIATGSMHELIYDKATQRILDLAYGKFENFVAAFLTAFDINTQIDVGLIADVNEVKCTRDCLIHSNGKANALYMAKASSKVRVRAKDEELKVDMAYFVASVDFIMMLITEIENRIPQKYKESTKSYVFKQMWEATCLCRRVPFETVWEIVSPSELSLKVDSDETFGYSSSEMEVFNVFRYAFGGRREHKPDFALLFERWEPSSNEYQIAMSWLNSQFFF